MLLSRVSRYFFASARSVMRQCVSSFTADGSGTFFPCSETCFHSKAMRAGLHLKNNWNNSINIGSVKYESSKGTHCAAGYGAH